MHSTEHANLEKLICRKPRQDGALIVGINMHDMHPHRFFHRRSTVARTLGQNSQELHEKSEISIGEINIGGLAKVLAGEGRVPQSSHNGKPCHMHPHLISDGAILPMGIRF